MVNISSHEVSKKKININFNILRYSVPPKMKRIVQSMFVNILISWLLLMESSHCKTSNRDVPNHDVYSSDYYKRLGVSRKASQKDIKSAFRKLGFKYHPDKCKESDCEEKFQKISEGLLFIRIEHC